jgi:hypothetical protein
MKYPLPRSNPIKNKGLSAKGNRGDNREQMNEISTLK